MLKVERIIFEEGLEEGEHRKQIKIAEHDSCRENHTGDSRIYRNGNRRYPEDTKKYINVRG